MGSHGDGREMTGQLVKSRSGPRKVIGILEVARAAGVSPATVSRVVNKNPTVDAEIRERVRETITRLKYRPHYAARNLPRGQTGNVAVATLRGSRVIFSNPFFTRLLEGIGDVLDQSSYNLMFSTTPRQMERLLSAHTVDGIILVSVREDDPFISELEEMDMPVVVAGAYMCDSTFTILHLDYAGGAALAVGHLVNLGHQRIGHLQGPVKSYKSKADRAGFEEMISCWGIEEVGSLNADEFSDQSAQAVFLEHVRAGGPLPTAYVASTDNLAAGLLMGAMKLGIQVPEDLSVIGFGDTALAAQVFPPLTSLRGDIAAMGAEATQILIELIGQGERIPRRIVYPLFLAERGSTAKPRA